MSAPMRFFVQLAYPDEAARDRALAAFGAIGKHALGKLAVRALVVEAYVNSVFPSAFYDSTVLAIGRLCDEAFAGYCSAEYEGDPRRYFTGRVPFCRGLRRGTSAYIFATNAVLGRKPDPKDLRPADKADIVKRLDNLPAHHAATLRKALGLANGAKSKPKAKAKVASKRRAR